MLRRKLLLYFYFTITILNRQILSHTWFSVLEPTVYSVAFQLSNRNSIMDRNSATTNYNLLWIAFQNGSQKAFETIYQLLFPVLYNYGYRLCQDEEQVKDCIQTIFMEVWQRRDCAPDTHSLKYYFLKIMRRKLFKCLDKRSINYSSPLFLEFLRNSTTTLFPFALPVADSEDEFSPLLVQKIQLAMEKLSGRKREAIILKFFENLTYDEISEVMELKSTKYARQLIYRSLDELKKYCSSPL